MEPAYEKLGAFYLGGQWSQEDGAQPDKPLLYDAKDLTTHAVCVGMTGSGKTGLCVSLLEEAAIDGVPSICIDPKGDLGNLLLAFPKLRPKDFEPWVDPDAAARKGLSVSEYAADRAKLWKKGLGSWNQSPDRIAKFKDAAEVAIYTPGSTAGLSLSVLGSFAAPGDALLEDSDALRERIQATVSGLLGLLGIDADPIRSREHIFLSNVLNHAWSDGRALELGQMIREIQDPPFDRVGVMDLESFFPAKERFELAMTLNNLLASPGFAQWMQGEPLDIANLLYTKEGKPRIAVLSIAHLSDSERMFFVTLVLNEMVAWMRQQRGTSSLRALLYMDEVFGYLPPSAKPPSKLPMLTLLKQARAFGLGVILATQNPVDLDYKALSNAGTWFLGRLQTERDKARVLDGLEGASTAAGKSFDRAKLESTLSGLKSRVFLLNNVHEDAPVLFHTRWVLSYLAGPLTRSQIKVLMADMRAGRPASAVRSAGPQAGGSRPVVPPGVEERFLPSQGGTGKIVYRPALVASAKVHYSRSRPPLDNWKDVAFLAPLSDDNAHAPWNDADTLNAPPDLASEPEPNATFGTLPSDGANAKSYVKWQRALKNHVYRSCPLSIWTCKKPKVSSEPGESEREFKVRLREDAHEVRDLEVEKLRKKYAPKLKRMEERIRKAEERVEREADQYKQSKMSTAISFGSTILGALFGRKTLSVGNVGRAGSAMRGVSRSASQKSDVDRAEQNVEALREQAEELEQEFDEAAAELKDSFDVESLDIATIDVRPKKTDTAVSPVMLVWTPWRVGAGGVAEPAFGERL